MLKFAFIIILSKIVRMFWNPETREILGKSASTWVSLVIYYLGFYVGFACFYAACIGFFMMTLDDDVPTMTYKRSMLRNNPGLNFEPKPFSHSVLIASGDSQINQIRIDRLKDVLSSYTNHSDAQLDFCGIDRPVTNDRACKFNVSSLGENCSSSHSFGYTGGSPCVLLRANRVYGWDPKVNDLAKVTCTERVSAPACQTLFQFQDVHASRKTLLKAGFVPISCQGQNPGDDDNILRVDFNPPYGLPSYHYPFLNQPGFQTPSVMAQFHVVPGALIMLWCRLWTGDIKHNMAEQQGGVKFQMLVESNATFDLSIWKGIS